MSLKTFHLFFIAISIILSVGLGIMALQTYMEAGAFASLAWSALSFAAAIALIIYGIRIRRKLRDVPVLLLSLMLLSFPRAAFACATCFGDPEAPQTQAMNMAILFMLSIVAMILASFAAFFVHLTIRAKRASDGTLGSHGSTPYLGGEGQ